LEDVSECLTKKKNTNLKTIANERWRCEDYALIFLVKHVYKLLMNYAQNWEKKSIKYNVKLF